MPLSRVPQAGQVGTGLMPSVEPQAAMEMQGIDELGLGPQDRKYLQTIIRVFSGGPAGVESIAYTMNASPDTLVDEVEPFLLRSELLQRTPRGRMATVKAYLHMKTDPPATDQTQGQNPQRRLFN